MVNLYFAPDAQLTPQDRMVLDVLQKDYDLHQKTSVPSKLEAPNNSDPNKQARIDSVAASPEDALERERQIVETLKALNNPKSPTFDPTVFVSIDTPDITNPLLRKWIIDPYIRWARTIVRVDTDVVMLTHLLLYLTTSIPSALYLFYNFHWWHAILHCCMQGYYMGTYTLMMHQHIHLRGILNKNLAWLDLSFPYITDPLMGHTWNSYYFHHVKHHHVEANGPDDLSSTVRFQRDDIGDFAKYVGRFYVLVWYDLTLYFWRRNKRDLALKVFVSEVGNYVFLYLMFTRVSAKSTFFVFLMPLIFMRLALMVGNWAQHAFVDETQPDSDFRSSITLIDVPSNRYCYNDGYHTSHHLNPLRHWRDHPAAFLSQKKQYSDEHALVFYNIDYLMITVTLLSKNYDHLAKCLVPMGAQMEWSMQERADMLRLKTRRFSEEEIADKWGKQYARLK